MSFPILSITIRYEHDTVAARQRARQIARLLGFDSQDQTRISTAVSEIARNAFNYAGGGRVEYILEGLTAPQLLIVKISDSGPGIKDLPTILEGRYQSRTGMGLGIIGTRRLMDQFEVDSDPRRGTTIWLKKLLPKRAPVVRAQEVAKMSAALAAERPQDAFQELQHQNQELLRALEDIRTRQVELTRVNRELEDTNRGVVALYAELDEKAGHLRRADELKSRFLSHMSHEFRSPLNSILALSGLLLDRVDGELTGEQVTQVGFVRRAAQELLELVNDLLDLAKVEAGKIEAKPVDFEVANLFAALRGMLRPLLVNQSVELVFEDTGDLPRIYSDEGKVSQILRNFISNALKFTERGEIRVTARPSGIGYVSFTVADTGIGIAPENIGLIFQDFGQVDHPIQRRVRGTGLGLPLSKKLATLLGGEVTVQSQPGSGSEFTLRIPVRFEDAAAPEPAPAAIEWDHDSESIPVLVVEDSPEMIMMYKSYLKGAGFHTLPAASTHQAEEILDRVAPGAIILDIMLRSEDTWAFAAKLKTDARFKDIPLMVVSTIEDRGKGFHLGIDRYLLKPIEKSTLIRELRALTGQALITQVLIVDDKERDRYLLKQKLKGLPVLIAEAPSALDGFRAACKLRPNLIFLDLDMPDLTGFELLEKLEADPAVAEIPVVIVTSRILTDPERLRLSQKIDVIVNKENLEHTDFADVLRRAAREAVLPAGSGAD